MNTSTLLGTLRRYRLRDGHLHFMHWIDDNVTAPLYPVDKDWPGAHVVLSWAAHGHAARRFFAGHLVIQEACRQHLTVQEMVLRADLESNTGGSWL